MPCQLEGSDGSLVLQAECASFERPLNPAEPRGNQIKLAVSRLRGSAHPSLKDAVLVINGGPGGSSRELLADLGQTFASIGGKRDIVVVDQRGTGDSAPLRCPNHNSFENLETAEDIGRLTRECLAALPEDPRYFTTSIAVTDLEALREALGYDKWSLYGVSYGTRVALHYTRRYPDRVRALIVDGIVPPRLILGANVVQNSETAFQALDQQCRADAECFNVFGSLRPKLDLLHEKLKAPQSVEIPHPVTGLSTTVMLGYEQAAASIRLLLYAPETAGIIPLVIDQALSGQFLPIAAQSILSVERVGDSVADGMHNAVVCTEDVPFFGAAEADRRALESTYLGARMIDTLKTVCAIWPRGILDADLHVPFESSVPALLLSGELDPITPSSYGEQLLPHLPNGRHLVARGQGHGVLSRGCMPRLVTEFIQTLHSKALDAGCLEDLPQMPIFINGLGPSP